MQNPQSAQTFSNIMAAIGQADRERALRLATDALKAGDEQPLVLMLAAERLEEQGERSKSLDLLRRALSQEQDEPELWRRYGQLLAKTGRLAESVQAFEEALDIDPDNFAVLIAAGDASYRASSLAAALSYYERADRLKPDEPNVLSMLAAIYAGLQDAGRARELGQRALQLSPQNVTAQVALARADLLSGDAEAALRQVSPILQSQQKEGRVAALDIAAEALDALGRTSDAFKTYGARNALLDEIYSPLIVREMPERRVDQARRIASWLRSNGPDIWTHESNRPVSPFAGHAFILSFPRSGTTLLEKSLSAHAGVATLPEIDLLEKASDEFLRSDDGLLRLAKAAPSDLQLYRESYWRRAEHAVEEGSNGKVLVDKLPLHTLALPLIARLFPDARILFAIRDPRDVVLSCFRRRFQVNSAMYEFLTLERTANFYDAVMELATVTTEVLPLQRMDVRHEALVLDFEQRMQAILQFIGREWDDSVREFSRLAKENPRTPSDLQLVKGLSTGGIAQWERYRAELQPVMSILEPWVNYFSYGKEQ